MRPQFPAARLARRLTLVALAASSVFGLSSVLASSAASATTCPTAQAAANSASACSVNLPQPAGVRWQ